MLILFGNFILLFIIKTECYKKKFEDYNIAFYRGNY